MTVTQGYLFIIVVELGAVIGFLAAIARNGGRR